jgi:hypothetical protein
MHTQKGRLAETRATVEAGDWVGLGGDGGLEAGSDHDDRIAPLYLSQYFLRATLSGAILAAFD